MDQNQDSSGTASQLDDATGNMSLDLSSGLDFGPSAALRDPDLDGDTLREECGVFGIYGHADAAPITALGLHALQHRGQAAAGLVRYATTGATILRNVQPLFAELNAGGFAVGHNGNLSNGLTLRRELVRAGAIMQSTTDTEVILHLVAHSRRPRLIDRFIDALRAIEGAYALVCMTNKKLIGARDPLGIRPLVYGELAGCPILASETCALDMIGACYICDFEPGEVVVFDEDGLHSHKPFPRMPARPCVFEYIYFARPDSIVGGRSVYEVRKAFGAQLAGGS